jgi:hypothetical protein
VEKAVGVKGRQVGNYRGACKEEDRNDITYGKNKKDKSHLLHLCVNA